MAVITTTAAHAASSLFATSSAKLRERLPRRILKKQDSHEDLEEEAKNKQNKNKNKNKTETELP